MNDRDDYRSQQQGGYDRQRQPEQWDDQSYRNDQWSDNAMRDETRDRFGRSRYGYDDNVELERGNVRLTEEDMRQLNERREGRRQSAPRHWHRHDNTVDRGYGRFTSESYGGRDFANPGGAAYYGYAASGAAGLGPKYPTPYDDSYRHGYDPDRGERSFLDRAGDEIASWFGDNDAARRREMDHRGNGPQGYRRSDERILEDVCDRLTEDRFVDGREITVTVEEGEVTLNGTVTEKFAKRRAEDCADRVSGVGHVQNNLRVRRNDTSV